MSKRDNKARSARIKHWKKKGCRVSHRGKGISYPGWLSMLYVTDQGTPKRVEQYAMSYIFNKTQ